MMPRLSVVSSQALPKVEVRLQALPTAKQPVERVMPLAKVEEAVPDELKHLLTAEEAGKVERIWRGTGCKACRKTGISGRKPIFEVMSVRSAEMRQIILSSRTADVILEQAIKEGMTSLRCAALACVAAGDIAPAEAVRVMMAG